MKVLPKVNGLQYTDTDASKAEYIITNIKEGQIYGSYRFLLLTDKIEIVIGRNMAW